MAAYNHYAFPAFQSADSFPDAVQAFSWGGAFQTSSLPRNRHGIPAAGNIVTEVGASPGFHGDIFDFFRSTDTTPTRHRPRPTRLLNRTSFGSAAAPGGRIIKTSSSPSSLADFHFSHRPRAADYPSTSGATCPRPRRCKVDSRALELYGLFDLPPVLLNYPLSA